MNIKNILTRYIILILIAIPGIYFFHFIFTPLTLYPVYFILSLFYDVSLAGSTIMIAENFPIEIIGACIAGSAYHLLLILNLATPNIKVAKRIKMIFISFLILLIINLLRIIILSVMFVENSPGLDTTHKILWYLGSTVFVVGIWFWQVKYFKIKQIPFYSDMLFLSRLRKKSNNTKGCKKNN